jgi:hypothetical protein
MTRARTRAAVAAAALALPLLPAANAVADPAANATDHQVVTQTDYFPKPGDDPGSFYGIFSLDGACGFPSARFRQSDTETFFIAQHENAATGYRYNAVGKIDDEPWTLTPLAADGTPLPAFSGTADEVATSRGIDDGMTPLSVNYTFDGTATDPSGQRLRLIVKGVLRTDADHMITRFDWGVQSCQVHTP